MFEVRWNPFIFVSGAIKVLSSRNDKVQTFLFRFFLKKFFYSSSKYRNANTAILIIVLLLLLFFIFFSYSCIYALRYTHSFLFVENKYDEQPIRAINNKRVPGKCAHLLLSIKSFFIK